MVPSPVRRRPSSEVVVVPGGRRIDALWLALAGAFLGASALLGTAAQETSEGGIPRVVDRVVAVVDQDPLLLSDIEQVVGLGLVERREDESDSALRRRVLDGLIEQRLRLHEVGRFGSNEISVEAIETRVRQLRSELPDPQALDRRLEELGMTEDDLRQLLARQETVLRYVEERLGPRVFVSLDDVRAYYEKQLVPVLEQRGASVPPLEDVQEEIRGLLKSERLNEEIDRWTEELRRQADIEILLDDYPGEPPPIVDRIAEPADPAPRP